MNRRGHNITIAVTLILLALVLAGIVLLTAALVSTTQVSMTGIPTPSRTTGRDPYAIFLQHAGWHSGWLTREQAQARAYQGCGQTFAPKTVDAVLADAYRPTGICK